MSSRQGRERRQGVACRACRSRKLGCDKTRPKCGRCRDAGRSCAYDTDNRPATTEYTFINETPQATSSASTMPNVAAGPSFQVHTTSPSEDMLEPLLEIPASRLAAIESRLEALTAAVRSAHGKQLEGSSHRRPETGESQSVPVAESQSSTELSETENLRLGHLSIHGNGRARFVTGAFWANICDEASAIDDMLREQTRYTGVAASNDSRDHSQAPSSGSDLGSELSNLANTAPVNRYDMYPFGDIMSILDDWDTGPPVSSRYQKPMPDIVSELPPKALCDCLFESFVEYYHPVAPLVHIPSTRANYNTFWQSSTQMRRTREAQHTPLIAAILFAGANACEESVMTIVSGRTKAEILADLQLVAVKAMRYANFPRTPTLESLAAFLLVQNTSMREEQPLTCCSYVGTAVRVAQMLGCNHDPSRHPSLSPVEAEVRRRIGWQVYYLDAMVALAAGLPPLIDHETWSVNPISELKDEFIGTTEGAAYDEAVRFGQRGRDHATGEDSFVSASGIFNAGKYHQTVVTRSTLTKIYGEGPITGNLLIEVQQQFEALRVDLASRTDRLLPFAAVSLNDSTGIFTKWSGLLLSALANRNWSYLYYPLSHVADKIKWDGALDHVLQQTRSYLEKMITLTGLEEFGPLQWSWPGIHQPLHSMLVLLRHLTRFPQSPHSEANRTVVDEALSLCGPDGGMVGVREGRFSRRPLREGGQEAWTLIRNMRAQAWQVAGLDPDVLLTRAETMDRVRARINGGDLTLGEGLDIGGIDEAMLEGLEGDLALEVGMDWLQWE